MKDADFIKNSDAWLDQDGTRTSIVASSRVRFARNLPDVTFPMRAHAEDLETVGSIIARGLEESPLTRDFRRFDLDNLDASTRSFLRENHFISSEFEKGGEHRFLSLSPDLHCGLMVNEEDHLRMYCVRAGFCLDEVLRDAIELDDALAEQFHPAYDDELGYLTACPTNTGTGMRASVMLHLPGLVMTQRIQEITDYIPDYGLAVRGFYGENSEFLGDYFQISNEQTLGKSEEQIVSELNTVVSEIADKEREAREYLLAEKRVTAEDVVWRSYALLTNARMINTSEAAKLLSKLRLGLEMSSFPRLTHPRLTKLFVEIQPAHLQLLSGDGKDSDSRDRIRAQLLRRALANIDENT